MGLAFYRDFSRVVILRAWTLWREVAVTSERKSFSCLQSAAVVTDVSIYLNSSGMAATGRCHIRGGS